MPKRAPVLYRAAPAVTIRPDVERRTYYFSGHVQGIGFRYTAQHLARSHPVSGFVRNLSDGRVEMVAEGEPKDLDVLAEALKRHMERFIRGVTVSADTATGEFTGFSVRH
jgi:acylphosphatase